VDIFCHAVLECFNHVVDHQLNITRSYRRIPGKQPADVHPMDWVLQCEEKIRSCGRIFLLHLFLVDVRIHPSELGIKLALADSGKRFLHASKLDTVV